MVDEDDLREAGIDGTDAYLTKLIVRVTAMIETYIGRKLTQQDWDEVYDGNPTGAIALRQYPVTGVTSVSRVLDPTILGFDDDNLDLDTIVKYNWDVSDDDTKTGILRIWGMVDGKDKYRVKYQAGYAQTPYDLEQVCIELCGFYHSSAKSAGIKSETLGEYSVTYGSSSGSAIQQLGLNYILDLYRTPSL
jgi:hypothetical protein